MELAPSEAEIAWARRVLASCYKTSIVKSNRVSPALVFRAESPAHARTRQCPANLAPQLRLSAHLSGRRVEFRYRIACLVRRARCAYRRVIAKLPWPNSSRVAINTDTKILTRRASTLSRCSKKWPRRSRICKSRCSVKSVTLSQRKAFAALQPAKAKRFAGKINIAVLNADELKRPAA
jgi:hypothetical protein